MFLFLNGFQSDCVLSCRRLHRFWKSCGESRSSWKVSRSKRSSSLDLILKLRRAADEHVLSLSLVSLSVINAVMDPRGNPDLSRRVSSAALRSSRAMHRGGGATPNSRRMFRSTDRESSQIWIWPLPRDLQCSDQYLHISIPPNTPGWWFQWLVASRNCRVWH